MTTHWYCAADGNRRGQTLAPLKPESAINAEDRGGRRVSAVMRRVDYTFSPTRKWAVWFRSKRNANFAPSEA